MTFTLTIELGNDAMKSPRHVAKALKEVAARLNADGFGQERGDSGYFTESIRDVNGNTVGNYVARKVVA